ncbi:MAG TPA: 50S ribosomal protein L4 [Bacteroidales bacterium]|nr:50S ribosomal protein L4 [Bacteroidales bacterium]HPI30082.1 50S ribosomal protein L4 [Bacteroidales bacterium]HPS26292.1 50S ribosomal protein L4 [Bacteroidales bacterium]HQN16368.1 50S ribosomal protein L4 [Bacteroidales bacterium]HQP15936.1 50S ribosomal protein L4 [Bacteroidales bacterium]
MELVVHKFDGSETTRKVALDDSIFGIEPNDHAIYLDVKQHLANKRQGTHSSRPRSMMSGSTRKLKRQKGTGGARSGDINSPVFVGGGRAFGPQPRVYNFKLNKKVKQLARISALTYKAKQNQIVILEDFTFDEIKTKRYQELLANLKVSDQKTLMVLPQTDPKIYMSSRNIQKAKVLTAASLNTYDILNAGNLLIVESSVQKINEMFKK